MTSKTSRLLAAALLLVTLAVLAPASPAHALPSRPHPRDDDRVFTPARAFLSLLERLFEMAGGAMDPNGRE
ncbi:MAG: hypothetical protein ACJ75H_11745 [Thermoanaerobaculia bacterium]